MAGLRRLNADESGKAGRGTGFLNTAFSDEDGDAGSASDTLSTFACSTPPLRPSASPFRRRFLLYEVKITAHQISNNSFVVYPVFGFDFCFLYFQPEPSFSDVAAASAIAVQTRDAAAAAIIAANAFNSVAEVHHCYEGGVEALATPLASPPFPPLWEDDDEEEEVVFDRGKFHYLLQMEFHYSSQMQ